MNMQSVIKKSQETKNTIASIQERQALEAEQARKEKSERVMEAIAGKARRMVETGTFCPEWMKKEAAQLEGDIITFIREGEGQSLIDYMSDGCGVFFGKNGSEALSQRDFGTYVLSLENAISGSHYPKVVKINVRAHNKLAKLIESRMRLETVSIFGVNKLLEAEKFGKLPIEFVAVEQIPEDAEAIELAQTKTIIGKETEIDVDVAAAIVDDKVFITRSDWFDGCGKVPEDSAFVFDLRQVRRPR